MIEAYAGLLKQQTEAKAKLKAAQEDLDKKIDDKYPTLSKAEIKTLAIDDKWIARISAAVHSELDHVLQTLTGCIRELGRALRHAAAKAYQRRGEPCHSGRRASQEDGGIMEVRPGYKKTEVGIIPDDWNVKTLGEAGESLIGLTYKPSDVRTHGILVLRSSNIQSDVLAFDDNVFVDTDVPERIKVRPGDLLVCVRNGSRNLIGKTALLDERTLGMTFGAFMAVYRSPIGNLTCYLFQSEILKRQINEHLGATINQITNKSLNSFRVPLSPLCDERSAIATALSDVDGLLAGLDRLIAKKRDLKRAAMQQLLTGQTRLSGFSGEWETKLLSEIASIHAGIKRFCHRTSAWTLPV